MTAVVYLTPVTFARQSPANCRFTGPLVPLRLGNLYAFALGPEGGRL